MLSWVSVGSATSTSGSVIVVGISDSVERSETAGLGLLSLFALFLPSFCLGIMKSNFNIYLNLKIMMKTVLGCGETVTD